MDDKDKILCVIDDVTFTAFKKLFSTGSQGYHANGKTVINGKRYTVNVLVTEIGSKDRIGG